MLYYIHLSGQPDRIKRSIRIELPKVNCSEYKQEGVFMQKTEYGYRRAVRIGIICLIFALCMGEYAFGSVVVDEVLIGGQEEQAPVDAAPAAQESAEPDALSKLQAEPDVSQPTSEPQAEHATSQPTSERKAKTAVSQPISEPQAKTESQSTSTSQEKTYTYLQNEKKVQNPSIKQADATSTAQTDPGQSKVPAESTVSVSANDRQQFHVPNQETRTNGDKTAKSGNSSGKNSSGETARQERKAQEQPSVWKDTAETTGKEKTEGGEETEEKTGGPLLPGFIILCIILLLAGSICLIRDNNIDLKK